MNNIIGPSIGFNRITAERRYGVPLTEAWACIVAGSVPGGGLRRNGPKLVSMACPRQAASSTDEVLGIGGGARSTWNRCCGSAATLELLEISVWLLFLPEFPVWTRSFAEPAARHVAASRASLGCAAAVLFSCFHLHSYRAKLLTRSLVPMLDELMPCGCLR